MATTRLGLTGIGVDAYGVFQPPPGPRPDGLLLTRLGVFGIMSARYRVFASKAPASLNRDNFFLVM